MFTFSACGAGVRIEPGVERGSAATPGIWRNHTSSPRSGRQRFVIRYLIIIEIASIAVARFAGWCDNSLVVPGVPLRSTPGSTLAPASAGWRTTCDDRNGHTTIEKRAARDSRPGRAAG